MVQMSWKWNRSSGSHRNSEFLVEGWPTIMRRLNEHAVDIGVITLIITLGEWGHPTDDQYLGNIFMRTDRPLLCSCTNLWNPGTVAEMKVWSQKEYWITLKLMRPMLYTRSSPNELTNQCQVTSSLSFQFCIWQMGLVMLILLIFTRLL